MVRTSRLERVAVATVLVMTAGAASTAWGGLTGDLNGDGIVDGADFAMLSAAWGECVPGSPCPADLNGDGVVDGADQTILLANWGLTTESTGGGEPEGPFDSGGMVESDPPESGGDLGGSGSGWDPEGSGGSGDGWAEGDGQVHVVPLPAPVLLTAIGLGLAGWYRRRVLGGATSGR